MFTSRFSTVSIAAPLVLLLAGCASNQPGPKLPPQPPGEKINTALQAVFSDMVSEIARARTRLSVDGDEVVVVPIDKLDVQIQGGYLNEAYLGMLRDKFVDVITDAERGAQRDDLAVVPYDPETFYRLMQTEGIQEIEDMVRPDNQTKITNALKSQGKFVHGFARLKLQEDLDQSYMIRIEFVPLNGSAPIRSRGQSIPKSN